MELKLYSHVQSFYTNLIEAIGQAQDSITMMYFTFDWGDWALKITEILETKQVAGVRIRLIVDEIGMLVDAPANIVNNRFLMSRLSAAGIEVVFFRPRHSRTTHFNRLHFKICSIDQVVTFVGGSNIGDEYLKMDDLNLRLDGAAGDSIEKLYDYLIHPEDDLLHFSNLRIGEFPLLFTLPGNRQDVRRTLLGLILDAQHSIYIRTWYFLPDREIVNALLHQSERGCKVNILFSDRTRIPLIDAANYVIGQKLIKSGVNMWRYMPRFMHAKACWNDLGQVLFGSANLDSKALNSNYECSLLLQSDAIAEQLRIQFESDKFNSNEMDLDSLSSQRWRQKAFAYTSFLLSNWL